MTIRALVEQAIPRFVLGAALICGSACAGEEMEAEHAISLVNSGDADVYDFQLTYGGLTFPRLAEERFAPHGGRQYTATMLVPDAATVVWKSADRRQHREAVEIRRYLEGKSWFDGGGALVFDVNDATLRVFVIHRLPNFKEERTQIR